MSVVVPSTGRSQDLAVLQSKINTLAAVSTTSPAYQQSVQALAQAQRELVLALLDRNALNAASLLAATAVFPSGKVPATSSLPVLAAISALQTNITSWASTNPALVPPAQVTLAALQSQACAELLASGVMSAALVLSTQTFAGAN